MARTVVGKGTRPIDLERVGRYRIIRPLSKGGMALVFEARRESLAGVSPRVAIKLILPEHAESDTFQELFINEARLGASMHHQNLVQIQDFDRDGEHFFLVMEYVEGLTLRQVVSLCVRSDIPVPIGVIAEIGRQACDGLHHAHQATDEHGVHLGLVHRDVKPSNLMLNPHGVVKILDFGISKGNLLAERSGAVRGTWGYMAPEQANGRDVFANADVFGLATILYEMASRKPLFRKKTPDEIKRLLDDDHAARMAATLPAEYAPLVSVLVRALQRDPAARYSSAAELGRALSALLPDPITARDEVVRFYRVVEAIDQGRPLPAGAAAVGLQPGRVAIPGPGAPSAPTQGSLVAQPSDSGKRGFPWLWVVAGVVATVLLVPAGIGVGLALAPRAPSGQSAVLQGSGPSSPRRPPVRTDPVQASVPEVPLEPAPTERPPPAKTVPARAEPDVVRAAVPDAAPAPAAEPEPEAPVIVRIDRRAPPVTIVEVPETPEAPEAAQEQPEPVSPAATGIGWVTLSAQPYLVEYDVFIDGKLVPKGSPTTPVVRHALPAGTHFVTISSAGGARKQFELTIEPDQTVRRVWDFERNVWRR